VEPANSNAARRQRHVLRAPCEIPLTVFARSALPRSSRAVSMRPFAVQRGPYAGFSAARELRDAFGGLAERALTPRYFTRAASRRPRPPPPRYRQRAVRERLQVFTGPSRRSPPGNTKPAVRSGRRRASAVPPVFPLVEEDARSKRYRASPGRLFCRSAPERIPASSA